MPPARRIAISLPAGPDVQASIDLARWAEEKGYDDAWIADGGAPDALTLAGILGAHTRSLRIGTAVTPVYTRTPAVLSATANTIGQVLPGRFVLGLGSSSHVMMEGWHGQVMEKPLTRVYETLIMVRSMLAGEKSNFDWETLHSHGYRQAPMADPPPIYLAALRPKMIEMAAEFADGVVFNLWPRSALPRMMEHVHAGAARAGKQGADVEIVNRYMVCVTDDVAAARDRFRMHFSPYYATAVYNRFLAWAGYGEVAAEIEAGWKARDRARTMAALSDALIDEIAVIGCADHCRALIRAAADGGVHTHIIASQAASEMERQATMAAFSDPAFSF